MPRSKDLKKRVRARMQKTGESYSAARAKLLAKRPAAKAESSTSLEERAGTKDATVRQRTGEGWAAWVSRLDAVEAATWSHKEIAQHLHERYDVSFWWAQTLTIGYERIRGLRAKGQRRGGGFDVNKSKTFHVSIETLYRAFQARERRRWLDADEPKVKTATRHKSMRLTWHDGRPVNLYFWEKGPGKSQVQLQHGDLPSKAAADGQRAEWTTHLAALAKYLAR